jgi:aldehyde dehydrogenase (NAD+)
MTLAEEVDSLLRDLGVPRDRYSRGSRTAHSPLTGATIGSVQDASSDNVTNAIMRAEIAFRKWRSTPAPRRGELVRLLGEELRGAKAALGRLVSIETGKVLSEGHGEVQEMIDICDFAVGLSRQLYGLTIASERPNHRMMEQWHPLGPVGVITSFNFPVAVWSWNAALALVCGYRRDTGRRFARAAGLGDRLHRHGPDDRTAAGPTLRPGHSRTRWQQRIDCVSVGGS